MLIAEEIACTRDNPHEWFVPRSWREHIRRRVTAEYGRIVVDFAAGHGLPQEGEA